MHDPLGTHIHFIKSIVREQGRIRHEHMEHREKEISSCLHVGMFKELPDLKSI
ncbi:hypothetical protein BSM4216_0653 [Bacillus smithii]|nr:hypothetical protein BSM4216_0653 [Bacillus smithii]